MKKWRIIVSVIAIALVSFLVWRFIRPMNIFVVSELFERPIDTTVIPKPLNTLRAVECAVCHQEIYKEWSTSIHSMAWTDPYFQVDWRFDGSQQICKNCHIPLDRQQEHKVTGFYDREKWKPILIDNPEFDPELQQEGVTCAVCHLHEGKILGPYDSEDAPHPVQRLTESNEVCLRCHVVGGKRWDTFYRIPPCGTVVEVLNNRENEAASKGQGNTLKEWGVRKFTGGITVQDVSSLKCVQCHMPLVERPIAQGGKVRITRRHLWHGGHDPEMVKGGLNVSFEETSTDLSKKRSFLLTLTNVGTSHYLPTGTPDRHLTIHIRLLDDQGRILKEKRDVIKRTILWRPFIVDLWDTRLQRLKPQTYYLEFSAKLKPSSAAVEAVVRYHLLDEKRRRLISYENKEPIDYEVFRKKIPIIIK